MLQYFEIDREETVKFVSSPPAPRQKSYHEIMWVQNGTADFIVDGDIFNVHANAFFIIPRERYHQFLPNEAISGQVIRFSEDFLDDFPRLLFSKFSHVSEVKIEGETAHTFELLFQLFKQEYSEKQDTPHVMMNLLKTIIYKLDAIKRKQFPGCSEQESSIDLFDQFQLLLDQHITEHKKVSFYAELLHITPRKLGDTIKLILNNTTENIILQRLLIEAKRQLKYTNKTVTQVAYDLGFQDNSYFTKFFKKMTNMTPKQYRSINLIAK